MHIFRAGQTAWLMTLMALVASTVAAQEAAPSAKSSVLVLMPTGEDVPESSRRTVTNLISVELQSMGHEVITQDDVKKAIELEAEKAAVGCDDAGCLAELAGALGAENVIFGDVGALGSTMVWTFNLYDSEEARSTARVSMKVKSLDEVPDKLPTAVAKLMGKKLPPTPPPAETAAADTSSSTTSVATTDGKPAEVQPDTVSGGGGSSLAWAWWTMAGVGGAVFIGGAATDLLLPSSRDLKLDGFDAIGPVIWGTGLVLVGTGVALAVMDVGGE